MRYICRILVKEVGHFVVAEVLDMGIQIYWDKGTRVNLQIDQKWKNHVKITSQLKYFIVFYFTEICLFRLKGYVVTITTIKWTIFKLLMEE